MEQRLVCGTGGEAMSADRRSKPTLSEWSFYRVAILTLLMFPEAPLGRFHLLFTLKGVYIAQSCLALPVIVALTASAVSDLPPGLLAQARAYAESLT